MVGEAMVTVQSYSYSNLEASEQSLSADILWAENECSSESKTQFGSQHTFILGTEAVHKPICEAASSKFTFRNEFISYSFRCGLQLL